MSGFYIPILLYNAAVLLFALSDVFAKILSQDFSPFLIAFFRYLGGVLLLVPLLLRHRSVLRRTSPGLQMLRAFCIFAATVTLIWSLQFLPIAQATTLAFASPLITTLLAIAILGEKIVTAKVLALLIGAGGTLLIANPGFEGFQAVYLIPILSAAFWSAGVIIVKFIPDDPIVTFRSTVLFGAVLSSAPLFFFPLPPISPYQLLIALCMAACWSGAQMLTIMAYRYGKATVVAPVAFLQIVWSVIFGYLVFGEAVSTVSVLGMALIGVSGFLILSRTR